MLQLLKAEFRKLFTTRSTYVLLFIVFALMCLAEFYVAGYRSTELAWDSHLFMAEIFQATNYTSIFIAFVTLLLVANEYRYNTIAYTLTGAKNRTRVFVAKFIVMTVFALVCSLAIQALTPLLVQLGSFLRGTDLAHQSIYYWDTLWRCLFFTWGFSAFAFVTAFLVRSHVAASLLLFVWPTTGEGLIGLLLKGNARFLPFQALGSLQYEGDMSHGQAALVFLGEIIVLLSVTYYLFRTRDAN